MRGNLLDVLDSDYVKFARAKGLSEGKVIFKHALRNAVNPLITLLGFEFAGLLSGAALTGSCFALGYKPCYGIFNDGGCYAHFREFDCGYSFDYY